MNVRDKSATVDLKVRMKEPLRASLEQAARKHGVSMNSEAVARLERSLLEETVEEAVVAKVFGGPEVHEVVRLAIAAFYHEGTMEAHKSGHPEWSSSDWIKDPHCYVAAAHAVINALTSLAPAGAVLNVSMWSTSRSFTPNKEPDQ